MGTPKGLLSYKNSYWLLAQIAAFKTGKTIIIGLGYDFQLYFNAIPWLKDAVKNPQIYNGKKVQVVINQTPEFGLFSTLQVVLKVLITKIESDSTSTGSDILVLPVDVPLLNTSELEKIIETENTVVIPNYHQKNGHPAKLSADFWIKLLAIPANDKEARLDTQIKKLPKHLISIVHINDKNSVQNLNTPESWGNFISN
ncbi:MAG: NTP transferase domain-containing protein [Flavobacteriaceae bacterium]|nr:NTP transferase domain-containing protein [Flavobacteriaceae bacterium]